MPLSPGTRLGSYEILAAIGEGGMGEVYRAKDTKLDREVAIKVLPEALALDPDRRARFEREAKAVATLSHPNILAIFDFGVHDAVAYAAMELLSGETLRERLSGGALPLRKATEAAVQVARGLAAAHDKGLVHRDIKPENIFLLADGQVKILDFGLTKAVVAEPGPSVDAETIAGTDPGTVLGTVGYMSPEQVRGQMVDARSDSFSLGAVLYEMLTGQRAFHRDTAAESMTAILKDDPPDMVAARADLHGALERIVRHCLEKTPTERFQTARDIAFALEALSGSGTARVPAVETRPGRGTRPLARAAAIVVTAVAGLAAGWLLREPVPPAVRTLDITVEGLQAEGPRVPVVSPDGRRVLYVAEGRVWVRELDGLDPIELAGTEGARYASWSPDSRSLALVKDGRLVRMPIDGGTGVALGNVPIDMAGSGATLWLPDGRILLVGSDTRGVAEISDRGGDLKDVVPLDKNADVDFHELAPLPDGRGVIYTAHRVVTGTGDTIEVFTDGARHVVLQLPGENLRRPVYSPSGHLLYQRETTTPGIWAVKFSPASLKTEGDPFLVVPGASWPSISADGTLAFVRPSAARPDLVWSDRAGVVTRIATLPQSISSVVQRNIALSPDGTRAAVAMEIGSVSDLWLYDLPGNTITQMTQNAGFLYWPAWSANGSSIVFSSSLGGRAWNLFEMAATGGRPRRLTTSDRQQEVGAVAPDGRSIVFAETGDLFVLPIDAAGTPGTLVQMTTTPQAEDAPRISPDGRWVAYTSNQSGRNEVFVRAYPSGRELRAVSSDGGTLPIWSRDGRELLYRSGERMMVAAVTVGRDDIEVAPPRVLFTSPGAAGLSVEFDVAADGRFLMWRADRRDRLTLILNWPEALKRIETSGAAK